MRTFYYKFAAAAEETLLSSKAALAGPASLDYQKIKISKGYQQQLRDLDNFQEKYRGAFTAFNKNIDLKYNLLKIFIYLFAEQTDIVGTMCSQIGFKQEDQAYLVTRLLEFGFPEYIDFFQDYELKIIQPVLDKTLRAKQQQGLTLAEMNLLADLPENDTRLEVKPTKEHEELLWRARMIDYKKMEDQYLAQGYKMLAQCCAELVTKIAKTKFKNFRKYIG